MKPASLLGHLAEIYRDAVAAPRGAHLSCDTLIQQFFSARRYLGSRDRAWLSDQFWPLLRQRLRWEALAAHAAEAPALPAEILTLIVAAHTPGSALQRAFGEFVPPIASDAWPAMLLEASRKTSPESPESDSSQLDAPLAWWHAWSAREIPEIVRGADPLDTLRTGWPGWLGESLNGLLAVLDPINAAPAQPMPSAGQHIEAFQNAALLTLRVNPLRVTRRQADDALAAAELSPVPGGLAPDALLLARRARLHQLPLFRSGGFEVQDEGSQLIAWALNPQPGWRVLDACAGGGGKTLQLAALMQNQGVIYASDSSAARIAPLPERTRRAGANILRLAAPTEAAALRDLDAVLIDAPCTGVGTLRRHPELAWKINPEEVQRRAAQQLEILKRFAPCVREGGLLVYATCSFISEENDGVIGSFLATHPEFRAEPVAAQWEAAFSPRPFALNPALRRGLTPHGHQLLPALHGCDAFFISVLRHTRA